MLAAYVSSHGYGHLMRTCEVLRAVRARAPSLKISLTTAAPASLVHLEVAQPFEVRTLVADVGVVQRDALEFDVHETAHRCRLFDARFDDLAAAEAAFLRLRGAKAVLGDVPPLAFAAAARAGIPSIALTNFSWDFIYAHLSHREPALRASAERAAAAYREAEILLQLPFACDLGVFERREEVGMVARLPRLGREEVRRRLDIEGERRPVVLLSFGGIGLPSLTPELFGQGRPFRYLFPAELVTDRLERLGIAYQDVVGAVDAAVSKPGYGIVTDAIGARTPLVYTDRGDFPEYPVLVAEMARWLPAAHVSNDELRAGRLDAAVQSVLGLAWPPAPELGGAARAAERILARVG